MLEYRNAVILMLFHTSLLLNWAQEIHPARHKCDTSDMSLLCAFYSLATSYWHGDVSQDTLIWGGFGRNCVMRHGPLGMCTAARAPGALWRPTFGNLGKGSRTRTEGSRIRNTFSGSVSEHVKYVKCAQMVHQRKNGRFVLLNASFRRSKPHMKTALYTVAEAINHHFQFGQAS